MSKFKEKLIDLCACSEAVAWVGEKTLAGAWVACERADWTLWLAGELPIGTHQDLVHIAAWCARRTLPHAGDSSKVCVAAIAAAERWADDPTSKNKAAARAAARAAGDAEHKIMCDYIRSKIIPPNQE